MNISSTILAAGPLVSSLGAVFGPVLCGLAFAVLSMGSFNGVYEDLNNPEPNPDHAILRGYSHLLMCSIVFATLMVVSPRAIALPLHVFCKRFLTSVTLPILCIHQDVE